ncbi:ABC-F family ATP-binding cassette domain-containing protein [Blautia sp. 1033sp1_1033st1_G9_1033SCRN_220408]|uniref:ABC-F family ATP-binding cassette domain-containing protein n=1 Tax=Blautia sp. 1033sp1_1033st1_G9_1033SCRN_220408 TaxID=3144490 RepID=UPI0034A3FFC1
MSILNVEHLTHGFGDRAIFHDVSFRLLKGEHIGLVGANGEGKSTFFNIVTGKLMPDEGKIEWSKNVRIGYLDQHSVLLAGMTIEDVLKSAFSWLFQMEERMNSICDQLGDASPEEMENLMEELGTIQDTLTLHDFYVIDAKVEEVARALGLLELGLDRDVTDLSGGQRTKVLLAKLLLEKPDILLLDEPTNYLDVEHIAWLKRYLQDYENAFILISHDISFLNDVINLVYHMENQELNRYVGDYTHFQEVYEVKKAQLEAAYRKQQQEISELKDFVARNKARVATRNMAMSRQKKLDKMDLIQLAAEKPKPEFHFKAGRTPGKYIFETKDLVIGYDEPLSKPLTISMERGHKIALTGANGIGKTTLLKSILGLIPPLSGSCELGDNLQIGYFEQEIKGDNKTTCIDEIWAEFPSYTQYEVRSALAKCGLTTKHIESQVRVLSGGEQAKVRLCKLVNKETNVLLLDEPTNHLDVDAKEALKQSLLEYRGSILLICHEPEFYQDIVSQVWDCSKWTTKIL